MVDKQVFQSYYTNSIPLINYMIHALDLESGLRILEPAAGDGVFIDALLNIDYSDEFELDAYEIDSIAHRKLTKKYGEVSNVNVSFSNALFDSKLDQFANDGGVFDRVIANPPYGGWLDYDQRKDLKKRYSNLYVKETYTVFLYRCIQLLKNDGKLVFIIPDTFLNLHMHTRLRKYLLENTKILELCLFPSSFFPNVNFAYANLCIITLQKSAQNASNSFSVYAGFKHVEDLETHVESAESVYYIKQKDMFSNIDHALFISEDNKVMQLINNAPQRIGDIANCVTGFYSGNDKKYLKTSLIRKNYEQIDRTTIYEGKYSKVMIDGVDGECVYVPIVKGGGQKYIKRDEWFMLWSNEAVKDYKSHKKARFQNSSYYFRDGLGVPMVSSSQITAALLENRLFDQSIVGIFPRESTYLFYLLAFFNSSTCNKLIRTINPSVNNSASYIRKIPLILPEKDIKDRIDMLISKIIELCKLSRDTLHLENEIEQIIARIYGF